MIPSFIWHLQINEADEVNTAGRGEGRGGETKPIWPHGPHSLFVQHNLIKSDMALACLAAYACLQVDLFSYKLLTSGCKKVMSLLISYCSMFLWPN